MSDLMSDIEQCLKPDDSGRPRRSNTNKGDVGVIVTTDVDRRCRLQYAMLCSKTRSEVIVVLSYRRSKENQSAQKSEASKGLYRQQHWARVTMNLADQCGARLISCKGMQRKRKREVRVGR